MPRYFFNVRTREHVIEDGEGSYLADLASVRSEALDVATDLIEESMNAIGRIDRRDAVRAHRWLRGHMVVQAAPFIVGQNERRVGPGGALHQRIDER